MTIIKWVALGYFSALLSVATFLLTVHWVGKRVERKVELDVKPDAVTINAEEEFDGVTVVAVQEISHAEAIHWFRRNNWDYDLTGVTKVYRAVAE